MLRTFSRHPAGLTNDDVDFDVDVAVDATRTGMTVTIFFVVDRGRLGGGGGGRQLSRIPCFRSSGTIR